MTIALGILAKDGLVIAADTQETYSGLLKMEQGKIFSALNGPASFHITGAGSATHLDSISQQLCEDFSRRAPRTMTALRDSVESSVRTFHVKHIAPYGG